MASQSPHPSVGGNKNTGEDENLWLLVNDVCIRAGDNVRVAFLTFGHRKSYCNPIRALCGATSSPDMNLITQ